MSAVQAEDELSTKPGQFSLDAGTFLGVARLQKNLRRVGANLERIADVEFWTEV